MRNDIKHIKKTAANIRKGITNVYVKSIERQIERNKEWQNAITDQLEKNQNIHRV